MHPPHHVVPISLHHVLPPSLSPMVIQAYTLVMICMQQQMVKRVIRVIYQLDGIDGYDVRVLYHHDVYV